MSKCRSEKTVWAFRENLTKTGLTEDIFNEFKKYLETKTLILNEGQMIDASFTVAPRQRNTSEEPEGFTNTDKKIKQSE